MIPATVAILSILGSIFLFRNRKLQLNIARFNGLLLLVITGLIAFAIFQLSSDFSGTQFGISFPVLALILNSLGIRGVKKDEKLVKSMDRLR